MKLFGTITIQPFGIESWQAHAPLLEPRLAGVPGVCGSQNKDGPWVGGVGKTPEEALTALRLAIGGVILGACVMPAEAEAVRQGAGK